MSDVIVFDFDGTLTNAEKEGIPFFKGALTDVAHICGKTYDEVASIAESALKQVLDSPGTYGWLQNGKIVAPASVDPYLRFMPIARKVLDHFGVLNDERVRSRILEGILFKYNYPKTDIVFRELARETLLSLKERDVYIVTNSHTDAVVKKLEMLASEPGEFDWLMPRVFGHGKKYVLGDSPSDVSETQQLPGLERPIYLRRPHYDQTLSAILEKAEASWSSLTVIGDIFELDLSLPLVRGAKVFLMKSDYTPTYEVEYLMAHERGTVISSLSELSL